MPNILISITLLLAFAASATPADSKIKLVGDSSISRKIVKYRCDVTGAEMGLPTGAFTVQYVNGDGNSLAILPIGGHSLIFANVPSGSGARYASGTYIWWDAAGRETSLESVSPGKTYRSVCRKE